MLKDRLALLEHEVIELTRLCGKMYLRLVTGQPEQRDTEVYQSLKNKLSDRTIEMNIVKQLLADGVDNER